MFELHFNASFSGKGNGTEALYYFEDQPETFYNATHDLAQITKEMYNWERVSNLWRQVIG